MVSDAQCYLYKRFEERLLDSPLLAHVEDWEDPENATQLHALIEGLYIECEGMDLR